MSLTAPSHRASDVLAGDAFWSVEQADAIQWLRGLPESSVDLVLGSPPYEDARTYGIDFHLKGQQWVDWMVEVIRECVRVSKGLIAFVVEGRTRNFRWSAVPAMLMADLHRAGFHLRKPPIFHRIGIPGSGGPDWWRNDYEFVVCVSGMPGRLPWSDNKACGHKSKYAVGGQISHRLADGNQWGMSVGNEVAERRADGSRARKGRKSHRKLTCGDCGRMGGVGLGEQEHDCPAIANPGNVLRATGEDAPSVIRCSVGGGHMGHRLAHESEAPYPLSLCEPFVRSFCRPGGIVADCFSGSGTTGHAAIKWGRRFIGCDIRESQVDLTKLRLLDVASRHVRG